MKKNFAILVAFVAALCMISCDEGSESLSASTAKKVLKKEITRLNETEKAMAVQVGYFECNDNDVRYQLRQLAANELITYKCEKVEKVIKGYWRNDTIETYFVTTALTEKGQKLVAEEKEVEPTEDETEVKNDEEFDWSQFPEASVDYQEFPEIKKPVEEEVLADEPEDGVYDDYDYDSDEPQEEPSAYDKAKAKESYEYVHLTAYAINIVKARNIEKTGDFTAECEFVLEYEDVTPVGRILGKVHDGERFLISHIHFKYYEDKGWTVKVED
jgi:hypothetical protein